MAETTIKIPATEISIKRKIFSAEKSISAEAEAVVEAEIRLERLKKKKKPINKTFDLYPSTSSKNTAQLKNLKYFNLERQMQSLRDTIAKKRKAQDQMASGPSQSPNVPGPTKKKPNSLK